ncbi:MAG: hypothetical protein C0169_02085 [Thermodesulfobacterium geofontis]|uniref:Uncharacterized protein n=1 Tax=Thermodesulfobacterium geofontis TaxID=1295609 RepID=A0A2N7QFU8_9BACT|nr:MAG: hypothetical protein C0169_02085 [Thermodesulfobacterium geofontis]
MTNTKSLEQKYILERFLRFLLHSQFFKDLLTILTGKETVEELLDLFLLSWDEEEALKGKKFEKYIELIPIIIYVIKELGFGDDHPKQKDLENKHIVYH